MSLGAAGRTSRLLWTLLPALLVLALGRLPLPGSPGDVALHVTGAMEQLTGVPTVGIFALGITPAIVAYVIVELLAFVVPPLRRFRHGGPEGRRKLERSARALAIALAAVQAWGIAVTMSSPEGQDYYAVGSSPSRATLVALVSLVGGFCISLIVADLISRRGLVNGIVLLSSLEFLTAGFYGLRAGIGRKLLLGELSARPFLILVLGLAIVAGATWFGLRGSGDARVDVVPDGRSEPVSPYRDASALALQPSLPIPSSSFAAFALAGQLLELPAVLTSYGVPLKSLADSLTYGTTLRFYLLYGALTALLVPIFALLLHRPSEMAELPGRFGLADAGSARDGAARARKKALGPTLLFFGALLVGCTLVTKSGLSVEASSLPIVIVLIMDGARALRVARHADLVPVWEERRASAVPVLRAALEGEGIEVTTSGMALLTLCQVFVPYAPARILVREADAPHAEAILRHLLVGDPAPERRPLPAVPVPPGPPAIAPERRMLTLGVLTAVGLAGLALVLAVKSASSAPPAPIQRAELEVSLLDDESGAISDDLDPEDIEIRTESVPLGKDELGETRAERAHFAEVPLRAGESLDAAIARGQAWAASVALRPGARFVWGPIFDWEPETGKEKLRGARSYVVVGEPILRTADIEAAEASVSKADTRPSVYVAITLGGPAAERFASVTRENINRRIAIIVDGKVNSAPVVRSAITGGRVSITMGAGDPETQLADAKKLAASLGGH